jgi:hypothetical protein
MMLILKNPTHGMERNKSGVLGYSAWLEIAAVTPKHAISAS